MRNKPSDIVFAASLKVSAHNLAHNHSEPHANCSRGSNGANGCFSNEAVGKIQICTQMLLQRALEWTGLLYSNNFVWLNTRKVRAP